MLWMSLVNVMLGYFWSTKWFALLAYLETYLEPAGLTEHISWFRLFKLALRACCLFEFSIYRAPYVSSNTGQSSFALRFIMLEKTNWCNIIIFICLCFGAKTLDILRVLWTRALINRSQSSLDNLFMLLCLSMSCNIHVEWHIVHQRPQYTFRQ